MTYDSLSIDPSAVAMMVATTKYTGREFLNYYTQSFINKIEEKRKLLTDEQIGLFVDQCDKRCRDAYEAKSDWFMKITKSKDGRNKLYSFTTHWLVAYIGTKVSPLITVNHKR
jgi:hypothetical protein